VEISGRWATTLIAAGSLLLAACSDDAAEPPTEPKAPPATWAYPGLSTIGDAYLSSSDPTSPPGGLDPEGVELWQRYREADAAHEDPPPGSSEQRREELFDEYVEAIQDLFAHLFSTGIHEELVAQDLARNSSTVDETESFPFTDERPDAVHDIDAALEEGGCEAVEGEYYPWLGQTNIDEVAGHAEVFARYALDRAAAAGCDWAVLELIEQAIQVSGLHR
jgi:uncharacterized protein YoaH (UPF0181 family)